MTSHPLNYRPAPTEPRPSLVALAARVLAMYAAAGFVTLWLALLSGRMPVPESWQHPMVLLSVTVVAAWIGAIVLGVVAMFQRRQSRRVAFVALLVCLVSMLFWMVVVLTQWTIAR